MFTLTTFNGSLWVLGSRWSWSRLVLVGTELLFLGSLQIFGTMRHTDIIFSKLAFSILEDTWISYYYVY